MNKGMIIGFILGMISAQAVEMNGAGVKDLIEGLRDNYQYGTITHGLEPRSVEGWDSKKYDNYVNVLINPDNTDERLLCMRNRLVGSVGAVVLRRWQDGSLKVRFYTVKSAAELVANRVNHGYASKGRKIKESVVVTTEIH